MNKSEQAQVKSKNTFELYQEMTDKVFNSMNQAVPRYHQSIANTQQEVFKNLESNFGEAIQTQKELAAKAGIPSTIPEAGLQAARDTVEAYVKMTAICNQMILSSIDAAQQGVKTTGENLKSLNDLNKNTMRSWLAVYTAAN